MILVITIECLIRARIRYVLSRCTNFPYFPIHSTKIKRGLPIFALLFADVYSPYTCMRPFNRCSSSSLTTTRSNLSTKLEWISFWHWTWTHAVLVCWCRNASSAIRLMNVIKLQNYIFASDNLHPTSCGLWLIRHQLQRFCSLVCIQVFWVQSQCTDLLNGIVIMWPSCWAYGTLCSTFPSINDRTGDCCSFIMNANYQII